MEEEPIVFSSQITDFTNQENEESNLLSQAEEPNSFFADMATQYNAGAKLLIKNSRYFVKGDTILRTNIKNLYNKFFTRLSTEKLGHELYREHFYYEILYEFIGSLTLLLHNAIPKNKVKKMADIYSDLCDAKNLHLQIRQQRKLETLLPLGEHTVKRVDTPINTVSQAQVRELTDIIDNRINKIAPAWFLQLPECKQIFYLKRTLLHKEYATEHLEAIKEHYSKKEKEKKHKEKKKSFFFNSPPINKKHDTNSAEKSFDTQSNLIIEDDSDSNYLFDTKSRFQISLVNKIDEKIEQKAEKYLDGKDVLLEDTTYKSPTKTKASEEISDSIGIPPSSSRDTCFLPNTRVHQLTITDKENKVLINNLTIHSSALHAPDGLKINNEEELKKEQLRIAKMNIEAHVQKEVQAAAARIFEKEGYVPSHLGVDITTLISPHNTQEVMAHDVLLTALKEVTTTYQIIDPRPQQKHTVSVSVLYSHEIETIQQTESIFSDTLVREREQSQANAKNVITSFLAFLLRYNTGLKIPENKDVTTFLKEISAAYLIKNKAEQKNMTIKRYKGKGGIMEYDFVRENTQQEGLFHEDLFYQVTEENLPLNVDFFFENRKTLNTALSLYFLNEDKEQIAILIDKMKGIKFPSGDDNAAEKEMALGAFIHYLELAFRGTEATTKSNREPFLAAYRSILFSIMGVEHITCNSGQDRTGYLLMFTDAIQLYYAKYGKFPTPYDNKQNRANFVTLFVDIFCSKHQQCLATRNGAGRGLKFMIDNDEFNGVLSEDIKKEITRRDPDQLDREDKASHLVNIEFTQIEKYTKIKSDHPEKIHKNEQTITESILEKIRGGFIEEAIETIKLSNTLQFRHLGNGCRIDLFYKDQQGNSIEDYAKNSPNEELKSLIAKKRECFESDEFWLEKPSMSNFMETNNCRDNFSRKSKSKRESKPNKNSYLYELPELKIKRKTRLDLVGRELYVNFFRNKMERPEVKDLFRFFVCRAHRSSKIKWRTEEGLFLKQLILATSDERDRDLMAQVIEDTFYFTPEVSYWSEMDTPRRKNGLFLFTLEDNRLENAVARGHKNSVARGHKNSVARGYVSNLQIERYITNTLKIPTGYLPFKNRLSDEIKQDMIDTFEIRADDPAITSYPDCYVRSNSPALRAYSKVEVEKDNCSPVLLCNVVYKKQPIEELEWRFKHMMCYGLSGEIPCEFDLTALFQRTIGKCEFADVLNYINTLIKKGWKIPLIDFTKENEEGLTLPMIAIQREDIRALKALKELAISQGQPEAYSYASRIRDLTPAMYCKLLRSNHYGHVVEPDKLRRLYQAFDSKEKSALNSEGLCANDIAYLVGEKKQKFTIPSFLYNTKEKKDGEANPLAKQKFFLRNNDAILTLLEESLAIKKYQDVKNLDLMDLNALAQLYQVVANQRALFPLREPHQYEPKEYRLYREEREKQEDEEEEKMLALATKKDRRQYRKYVKSLPRKERRKYRKSVPFVKLEARLQEARENREEKRKKTRSLTMQQWRTCRESLPLKKRLQYKKKREALTLQERFDSIELNVRSLTMYGPLSKSVELFQKKIMAIHAQPTEIRPRGLICHLIEKANDNLIDFAGCSKEEEDPKKQFKKAITDGANFTLSGWEDGLLPLSSMASFAVLIESFIPGVPWLDSNRIKYNKKLKKVSKKTLFYRLAHEIADDDLSSLCTILLQSALIEAANPYKKELENPIIHELFVTKAREIFEFNKHKRANEWVLREFLGKQMAAVLRYEFGCEVKKIKAEWAEEIRREEEKVDVRDTESLTSDGYVDKKTLSDQHEEGSGDEKILDNSLGSNLEDENTADEHTLQQTFTAYF